VSDGVQSLITEKFPGTIFCAVETSGDGAVNFQSRVQMYLFKAKQAAQKEFDQALTDTGLSLEQVNEFLVNNPRYAAPLYLPPHSVAHTAADLVHDIAKVYGKTKLQLAVIRAQSILNGARELALKTGTEAPEKAQAAAAFAREAAVELFTIAKEKGPGAAEAALGKAKAKLGQVLPMFKTDKAPEEYAAAAE
jgi:DNA-binding transcriptional MerR regulator